MEKCKFFTDSGKEIPQLLLGASGKGFVFPQDVHPLCRLLHRLTCYPITILFRNISTGKEKRALSLLLFSIGYKLSFMNG